MDDVENSKTTHTWIHILHSQTTYTHACTHARTHAHIDTCVHTRIHTQTGLNAHSHAHTHIHTQTHIHELECTNTLPIMHKRTHVFLQAWMRTLVPTRLILASEACMLDCKS